MGLLYTSLKIFHFPEKLESLPRMVDRILPPLHIRIKPTNVCNHRCSYCAYRVDDLQLGQNMRENDSIPKEKMMEIVDDVIAMGVRAVTFSGGGEPFCYPHFLDVVNRLAESSTAFASLTNGSRLRGEIAEVFAHHATWLRISLDGWDAASYSRYRGVNENAFGELLANIEAFNKIGGSCYLGVNFIVDRENYSHIYDVLKMMADLGVDSVKLAPCIVSNKGEENNLYHAAIFDQVKDEIGRAVSDFSSEKFQIYDCYHTLDEKFEKNYDWCPYLQILPVIAADCNVYTCHDKAYNLDCGVMGSLEEQSFADLWFSEKERFFSIDPSRDCNHHCTVNAQNNLILEYLDADRRHIGFV